MLDVTSELKQSLCRCPNLSKSENQFLSLSASQLGLSCLDKSQMNKPILKTTKYCQHKFNVKKIVSQYMTA